VPIYEINRLIKTRRVFNRNKLIYFLILVTFTNHEIFSAYIIKSKFHQPILVAVKSMAWVYGRSLAGIAGSNPAGGKMSVSCEYFVCCQVEVSATGRSLVQWSPTECVVSECEQGTSQRRHRPTKAVEPLEKQIKYVRVHEFQTIYIKMSPSVIRRRVMW
jgi:hypothetical protein